MKLNVHYSTFGTQAIQEFIQSNYKIGTVTRCHYLLRGMNDTYLIETGQEPYIFRVYRSGWRSEYDTVAFEIELLNHLHKTGIHVSLPVEAANKDYIHELEAPEGPRFGVLFTWAKGAAVDMETEEMCRRFGREAADLHNRTTDFHPCNRRPELDVNYLIQEPLKLIRKHMQDRPSDLSRMERIASTLRNSVEEFSGLDWGICHGDLHGSNAHIDQDEVTYFDFDLCGYGWRAYELAVFRFTLELQYDGNEQVERRWQAFLDGYRSLRTLNACDVAAVPAFVGIRRLWLMSLSLGHFRDLDLTGPAGTEEKYYEEELKGFEKLGL
ncbi:phosphotransferase enzyme family protein [Paenibacillus tarimensis]|uniref:phosphotransferase enzyme family protein n=1 Tax=Paenibacillus tarimensis TaxID=416012 RepID=UPI001F295BE5|nr:phosphotransferase [Paenibacillus tarimensis]MCF2943130.1 phosphotransferase [Paenibacillus tarimensis]